MIGKAMRNLAVFAVALPVFAAAPVLQRMDLPLSFEPNQGQAAKSAQFVARGTGYYLTLDGKGSRTLLRRGTKAADVQTTIVGSSGSALSGVDALPGRSSYFRGSDSSKWVTNVANYSKVRADGVYPGIDLVYYGNQKKLEYDFVVHPGANPGQIRLAFDGVAAVRKDNAGNLVLHTVAGNVIEHKPVIYQQTAGIRKQVDGSYRLLARNQVAFELGRYDHSIDLVIDPVLVYSSFLGGNDTDAGNSVAADADGNMYMTGITYSTEYGDADVLVRKISADGTAFLYTADLGGDDDDFGNGIAVDSNGYAYIGGRTASVNFPTANAIQKKNSGYNNAFVLRLNKTGDALAFSTFLGGSYDDRAFGLAIDPQGSVYLTGVATSDDFPTSSGAFQTSRKSGTDAFVAKFLFDGTAVYSTFLGGGSDDYGNAITVDAAGNAYVVGDTESDGFPQVSASYQHSRHGALEGFITEVNSAGTGLVFSTFIGGSGDDSCTGVSVDPAGNFYVVGNTSSGDSFSIPNRSYNRDYNGGNSDIFVAKYQPAGQDIAWITFLGSHGTDEGYGIATDANGTVYVVGDTNSDQYPVTGDAIQSKRGGNYDVTLSVLDTNGQNLLYSTFFGGKGDDSAAAVAIDPKYQVYLTGYTESSNLTITQGAVQSGSGGGDMDAFLAKVSLSSSSIPGSTPAPPVISSNVSAFARGLIISEPQEFKRQAITPEAKSVAHSLVRKGRRLGTEDHKPIR